MLRVVPNRLLLVQLGEKSKLKNVEIPVARSSLPVSTVNHQNTKIIVPKPPLKYALFAIIFRIDALSSGFSLLISLSANSSLYSTAELFDSVELSGIPML